MSRESVGRECVESVERESLESVERESVESVERVCAESVERESVESVKRESLHIEHSARRLRRRMLRKAHVAAEYMSMRPDMTFSAEWPQATFKSPPKKSQKSVPLYIYNRQLYILSTI